MKNHNRRAVTRLESLTANAKYHENDAWKPDDVFLMEQGVAGGDSILAFTQAMTKDGPALQFD